MVLDDFGCRPKIANPRGVLVGTGRVNAKSLETTATSVSEVTPAQVA